MSNQAPKVSIGLPVYNGEMFLSSALDSLLAQTFTDFELIISDNASTDRTPEICREYATRDPRIRYVRHDVNGGAPWNFNEAFRMARGEYFKWHAADDLCSPIFLERCVGVLDADSTIALCYPRTMVVDAEANPLPDAPGSWKANKTSDADVNSDSADSRGLDSPRPSDRIRGILMHTVFCYELFGLVRREFMARTGLHRDSSALGKAFLIELAFQGPIVEVPEVLFFNRRHAQQFTMIASAEQQRAFDRPAQKHRGRQWPHHFRCTAIYIGCIWRAPVSIWQRLRSYAALLRYVLQAGKWGAIVRSAWRGAGMWNGSIKVAESATKSSPILSSSPHASDGVVLAGPKVGLRSPGQVS
ncbi:MAG TPA: glycosyltransferase family 2 protein [Pirellulales bacterium]